MVTLRRVLALCLAATAAWLLSVLAAQTSLAIAGAVVAALIAAALLLRFAPAGVPRRAAVGATLAGALVMPVVLPAPAAVGAATGGVWQRFDPAAIAPLVREGKAVFVDVTADWCLNCKVNERLILDSAAVSQRLAQPEIVAMRADWTRPDAAIGAFLRGFGRFGIPFYAVFGPGTPEGQGLPEILTEAQVLEALHKAAPNAARSAVVTAPAGAREGG